MREFLNPNKILRQLKLKPDMVGADFGSGSGGWAIPLAQELEDGKVFAIDILEEPLSALKARLKRRNIDNVETVQSNVEALHGSKLLSDSCDLVLMTNLLFQIEDKETVLVEAKRALKEKGRILIVDWKSGKSFGPKHNRISSNEVKRLAEKLFLKIEKEFEASPYHWALILIK